MEKFSSFQVSYANASRSGKAVIKLTEKSTGRLGLIRRARGYDVDIARGSNFWDVMVDRFGLSLDVIAENILYVSVDGPLVIVANHPLGILDGLILGYLLAKRRVDFWILANSVFQDVPDIDCFTLLISFDTTKAAVKLNLETCAKAPEYLRAGGAIGVFSGGTVSTASKPFLRPLDPGWGRFTACLIAKSNATVVPIFFDGQNSKLFQVVSHIHYNLRVTHLLKEFRNRADKLVKGAIRAPILPSMIAHFLDDPQLMMNFLRSETHRLSPDSIAHTTLGFDFEKRYKAKSWRC